MFATAVELIEKSSSVGLTGQFERDRNANRSRRSCLEPPSFEALIVALSKIGLPMLCSISLMGLPAYGYRAAFGQQMIAHHSGSDRNL
jgi:hypothetical protein